MNNIATDEETLLFNAEEEEAEAWARANPVSIVPKKKGTKDWREGHLTFESFEAFSSWRKEKNVFSWCRSSHGKNRTTISGIEQYDWYSYQCASHKECPAAVNIIYNFILLYNVI